jgi:hypothetical protein
MSRLAHLMCTWGIKFGMRDSRQVGTDIVSRLSNTDGGNNLSEEKNAQYPVIVGSLQYLSCWTRPDISFAVSELSHYESDPEETGMKAAIKIPQGYSGAGTPVYSP